MSVRFLGRRVYLPLLVVLGSARHAGQNPGAARLSTTLAIPLRTLERWRQWWKEKFPRSTLGKPLVRASCRRSQIAFRPACWNVLSATPP